LETADVEKIRDGSIANELEMVNHQVRPFPDLTENFMFFIWWILNRNLFPVDLKLHDQATFSSSLATTLLLNILLPWLYVHLKKSIQTIHDTLIRL
jgi:hypothetical protein